MTNAYRCRNVRIGDERIFVITADGKQEFELRYQAMDRDSDPEFDVLELEMSDFFYWVARIWGDSAQKKELAANWSRSSILI
jgi:hypothetical protein